jgi:hypothetical protein
MPGSKFLAMQRRRQRRQSSLASRYLASAEEAETAELENVSYPVYPQRHPKRGLDSTTNGTRSPSSPRSKSSHAATSTKTLQTEGTEPTLDQSGSSSQTLHYAREEDGEPSFLHRKSIIPGRKRGWMEKFDPGRCRAAATTLSIKSIRQSSATYPRKSTPASTSTARGQDPCFPNASSASPTDRLQVSALASDLSDSSSLTSLHTSETAHSPRSKLEVAQYRQEDADLVDDTLSSRQPSHCWQSPEQPFSIARRSLGRSLDQGLELVFDTGNWAQCNGVELVHDAERNNEQVRDIEVKRSESVYSSASTQVATNRALDTVVKRIGNLGEPQRAAQHQTGVSDRCGSHSREFVGAAVTVDRERCGGRHPMRYTFGVSSKNPRKMETTSILSFSSNDESSHVSSLRPSVFGTGQGKNCSRGMRPPVGLQGGKFVWQTETGSRPVDIDMSLQSHDTPSSVGVKIDGYFSRVSVTCPGSNASPSMLASSLNQSLPPSARKRSGKENENGRKALMENINVATHEQRYSALAKSEKAPTILSERVRAAISSGLRSSVSPETKSSYLASSVRNSSELEGAIVDEVNIASCAQNYSNARRNAALSQDRPVDIGGDAACERRKLKNEEFAKIAKETSSSQPANSVSAVEGCASDVSFCTQLANKSAPVNRDYAIKSQRPVRIGRRIPRAAVAFLSAATRTQNTPKDPETIENLPYSCLDQNGEVSLDFEERGLEEQKPFQNGRDIDMRRRKSTSESFEKGEEKYIGGSEDGVRTFRERCEAPHGRARSVNEVSRKRALFEKNASIVLKRTGSGNIKFKKAFAHFENVKTTPSLSGKIRPESTPFSNSYSNTASDNKAYAESWSVSVTDRIKLFNSRHVTSREPQWPEHQSPMCSRFHLKTRSGKADSFYVLHAAAESSDDLNARRWLTTNEHASERNDGTFSPELKLPISGTSNDPRMQPDFFSWTLSPASTCLSTDCQPPDTLSESRKISGDEVANVRSKVALSSVKPVPALPFLPKPIALKSVPSRHCFQRSNASSQTNKGIPIVLYPISRPCAPNDQLLGSVRSCSVAHVITGKDMSKRFPPLFVPETMPPARSPTLVPSEGPGATAPRTQQRRKVIEIESNCAEKPGKASEKKLASVPTLKAPDTSALHDSCILSQVLTLEPDFSHASDESSLSQSGSEYSSGVTLDLSIADVSCLTNPTAFVSKVGDFFENETLRKQNASVTHSNPFLSKSHLCSDTIKASAKRSEASSSQPSEAAAPLIARAMRLRPMSDELSAGDSLFAGGALDAGQWDQPRGHYFAPAPFTSRAPVPLALSIEKSNLTSQSATEDFSMKNTGWDLADVNSLFPVDSSFAADLFEFETELSPANAEANERFFVTSKSENLISQSPSEIEVVLLGSSTLVNNEDADPRKSKMSWGNKLVGARLGCNSLTDDSHPQPQMNHHQLKALTISLDASQRIPFSSSNKVSGRICSRQRDAALDSLRMMGPSNVGKTPDIDEFTATSQLIEDNQTCKISCSSSLALSKHSFALSDETQSSKNIPIAAPAFLPIQRTMTESRGRLPSW